MTNPINQKAARQFDSVALESLALMARYGLLQKLSDGNGPRKDLRGADPEPALVEQMRRQFVENVDFISHKTGEGWPIRAGVRLENLSYSPWLTDFHRSGMLILPKSPEEFRRNFFLRTRIDEEIEYAFEGSYGFTIDCLADLAFKIRGDAETPSVAFLMLLSRHFDEAKKNCAELKLPIVKGHRRSVIDAFKMIAEVERLVSIVREISINREVTRRDINKYILSRKHMINLDSNAQSRRVIDYLLYSVSSKLYHNPVNKFNGRIKYNIKSEIDIAKSNINPSGMDLLFNTTTKNERVNSIYHDNIWAYYASSTDSIVFGGLSMIASDGWMPPGSSRENQDPMLAELAKIILQQNDNRKFSRLLKKSQSQKEGCYFLTTLHKSRNVMMTVLPRIGYVGSAAQFSHRFWTDRYVDKEFWSFIAESPVEQSSLSKHTTVAPDIAIRVICDMATSVSAISINPEISFNVRRWVRAVAKSEKKRKGYTISHEIRICLRKIASQQKYYDKISRYNYFNIIYTPMRYVYGA